MSSIFTGPVPTSAPTSMDFDTANVEFNGNVCSLIEPLKEETLEALKNPALPEALIKLLNESRLCLAVINLDNITPHPYQRPIEDYHVNFLVTSFGKGGSDQDDSNNWAWVIAVGEKWDHLYNTTLRTPIVIKGGVDFQVQCISGDHRIEAQRRWCAKHNKPEEKSWTCWVLRREINDCDALSLKHWIMTANNPKPNLPTNPTQQNLHLVKHISSLYESDSHQEITKVLHRAQTNNTAKIYQVFQHEPVLDSFDRLLDAALFFPEWTRDLDEFLKVISPIHSSTATILIMDKITENLNLLHDACLQSEDFTTSFTLHSPAAAANKTHRYMAFAKCNNIRSLDPNPVLTGSAKKKELNNIKLTKALFNPKALALLDSVFRGRSVDEDDMNGMFITPTVVSKSTKIKEWMANETKFCRAVLVMICGPMPLINLNKKGTKPMDIPIKAEDYIEGLVLKFLKNHDLETELQEFMEEHKAALMADFLDSGLDFEFTPSLKDMALYLADFARTLLTTFDSWYDLHTTLGLLPGDQIFGSAALGYHLHHALLPMERPSVAKITKAKKALAEQKRLEAAAALEKEAAKLKAELDKQQRKLEKDKKELDAKVKKQADALAAAKAKEEAAQQKWQDDQNAVIELEKTRHLAHLAMHKAKADYLNKEFENKAEGLGLEEKLEALKTAEEEIESKKSLLDQETRGKIAAIPPALEDTDLDQEFLDTFKMTISPSPPGSPRSLSPSTTDDPIIELPEPAPTPVHIPTLHLFNHVALQNANIDLGMIIHLIDNYRLLSEEQRGALAMSSSLSDILIREAEKELRRDVIDVDSFSDAEDGGDNIDEETGPTTPTTPRKGKKRAAPLESPTSPPLRKRHQPKHTSVSAALQTQFEHNSASASGSSGTRPVPRPTGQKRVIIPGSPILAPASPIVPDETAGEEATGGGDNEPAQE